MRSLEELKIFFTTDLKDSIKKVEAKRLATVWKMIMVLILTLGLSIFAGYYILIKADMSIGWLVLALLVILTSGTMAAVEISRNRGFYYDFKNLIIEQIMQFIHPSFHYNPRKFIPIKKFVESHLFRRLPNKSYKGDDYVVGHLDNQVKLEFSEVVAKYKKEDAKTTSGVEDLVMFKGLFFVATLPVNHDGHTVIVPRNVDMTEANFRDNVKLHPMNAAPVEILDQFNVFTSNDEASRQLLSKEVVQDILDAKAKRKGDSIHISFVGQNVFIGVEHGKDLFEPKLWGTLNNFEVIREYADDLTQAITIVDAVARSATKSSKQMA